MRAGARKACRRVRSNLRTAVAGAARFLLRVRAMKHRLLCVCAAAVVACAQPAAPSRPLAPYDARAQRLFDDGIDPSAVGMALDDPNTVPPLEDARLRERTELADGVVRARVETVTMKKEERGGHRVTFDLGVRVVETLAGKLPRELTVHLGNSAPSAGIVESMGPALADKTFVVFVRAFEGPRGRPRYYAHFSRDTKNVVIAVQAAAAAP